MNLNVRNISPRQAKALDCWIRDGFKSKAGALREAGYGKNIVDQPHKVFNSPKVLHELTLRGYDQWGRRRPLEAIIEDQPEQIPQAPTFDIAKFDRKSLQELKEKLGFISVNRKTPEVEIPNMTIKNNDTLFEAGWDSVEQADQFKSLSSM